jgi:L-iditol 2-dehydrogenase
MYPLLDFHAKQKVIQPQFFPKATQVRRTSPLPIRTNKVSRINGPIRKKSARLRSIPKLMNYAMKALVYEEPWKMTLRDLPKPDPAPGEVVIKIESVGICGSDVHGFTGESGRRAPGMVMGHEVVGRVVERADDVTDRAIGQRVTVFNILSDEAPSPEEGDPSFLNKRVVGVNLGTRGAMAEYLALPVRNAIPVSEDIPPEVSVLAEPVAVALHGFHRLEEKGISPKSVAIIGSGTIGLCSLLVARSLGLEQTLVLDPIAEKLERARSFGGKTVRVDPADPWTQIAQKVEDELGNRPDLVIDAVGIGASFDQAVEMVAEGGTILLIGNLAKQVDLPLQTVVSNEISLVGTYGFDLKAFEEAVKILPGIESELATFIEGRCTLEETPEVMTALAKGERQALKIVIDFCEKDAS